MKNLHLRVAIALKVINQYAFYYCTKIRDIKLDNCIAVGDYAFQAWYGQIQYSMGNGYNWVSSLEKVDLPNCTTMGYRAFYECLFLKKVNLTNVELINQSTFYNCIYLETVNLDACMRIDGNAFFNCCGLNSVSVSKDCDIDYFAFTGYGSFGEGDVARV